MYRLILLFACSIIGFAQVQQVLGTDTFPQARAKLNNSFSYLDTQIGLRLADPGSDGLVLRTASGTTVIPHPGVSGSWLCTTGAATWGWCASPIPSTSALLKGNNAGAASAATVGDVVGLWTGTPSNSLFLRSDGTLAAPAAGGVAWGAISGTLADQTDLGTALAGKQATISGAPGTWPSFATVATSGDYGDLLNKPSIPAAQVQSDWSAVSGMGQILNKPTLGAIAGAGYPGTGVANSTGSAWGTSYTVGTGANNLVQLNGSSQLPAVSGALLTNLPNIAIAQTPLTTRGDLLIATGATPALGRLAKGTQHQPLLGGTTEPTFGALPLDQATAVSGILGAANGGTGNGFFAVSGPASSTRTFTFPNASATVLTSNAAVTIAQGGTGTGSTLTGLMRGGASAMTAAELSGDATTSGSNAVTVAKVNGVAYASGPSVNTAPVVTATNTVTYLALPDCSNGTTSKLLYNTTTHLFSCGTDQTGAGGGTPAGGANAVQVGNGAGAFADSGCTATGGVMTCSGGFVGGANYSATGAEQAKPAAPAAGNGTVWYDSTAHLPQYEGSAGTVIGTMVQPAAARTANQFVTHVPSTGVPTTAAIADADVPSTIARLAGPTFTGVPAAPTAAADTSTTQLATTAFVIGQASGTNPSMDGTVAAGNSLKYARADHVHPTDTSRVPTSRTVNPATNGGLTGGGDLSANRTLGLITTCSDNQILKYTAAGGWACQNDATAVGGTGDVSSNTSTSVDNEIALFSSTGGKTIKRATGTGFVKVVSGVMQTPAVLADADVPSNITRTIASGQTAMPTGALAANTCSASATTATATGALTTDAVAVTYASDPTGVTGYGAGTSGGITIRSWLTANSISFKLCNETGSSVTPGALSVNWRVTR